MTTTRPSAASPTEGARPAAFAAVTQPAFLFDLDGTLIDSVYQHVIAWREALEGVGISLSIWKIHRRIGMSGGLFVNALVRELETTLDRETLARLPSLHAEAYMRQFDSVRALPGAAELLATLSEHGVAWAIATSGAERYARLALELLELPADTPLITRDQVRHAKRTPTCSSPRPPGSMPTLARASSWATRCGTYLQPDEPGRSGSVCYRVGMGARSCCTPARSGSTTIPVTCSSIWMKSASVGRSDGAHLLPQSRRSPR